MAATPNATPAPKAPKTAEELKQGLAALDDNDDDPELPSPPKKPDAKPVESKIGKVAAAAFEGEDDEPAAAPVPTAPGKRCLRAKTILIFTSKHTEPSKEPGARFGKRVATKIPAGTLFLGKKVGMSTDTLRRFLDEDAVEYVTVPSASATAA